MITETVHYQCNDVNLKGYLAYTKDSRAKRPAVVIAHAWRGLDEFAQEKARELADLGYVGFAADLYGDGKIAQDNDEAMQLMLPLFLDRQLLRDRMNAALTTVKEMPFVDSDALGAIGFCFGGLTVIELLRSGAPLRGVVSFHGLLGYSLGEHKAKKVENARRLNGSLLIQHGYKDPLVSQEDIRSVQEEFTAADIDWQMNIYGTAMHAFTNPMANDPENGMQYNPEAALRSWLSMCNFFEDVFPS